MTWRERHLITRKGVAEYDGLLRVAADEGWLSPLLAAHAAPCTTDGASRILDQLPMPKALRIFYGQTQRGWGGHRKAGKTHPGYYFVSLPDKPGSFRFGTLRIGLVLHEASHVLAARRGYNGHGPVFRRALKNLVTQFPWRSFMTTAAGFSTIYGRHRGPYTILLCREDQKTKKGETKAVHSTDRMRGPFSAEDAHETAKMLVTDPRDNVVSAFVFSETEQQFIGAFYERDKEIPGWSDVEGETIDQAIVDDPQVEEAPTEQPLPGVVDMMAAVTKATAPKAAKVRTGPPAKKGCALVFDLGNAERWPKSQGAQIVRGFFEALPAGTGRTAKEVVEALGDTLKAAGVEFPASLVSRLKQAGFLKEMEA